jgi:hypothetical protein
VILSYTLTFDFLLEYGTAADDIVVRIGGIQSNRQPGAAWPEVADLWFESVVVGPPHRPIPATVTMLRSTCAVTFVSLSSPADVARRRPVLFPRVLTSDR